MKKFKTYNARIIIINLFYLLISISQDQKKKSLKIYFINLFL